jgi:hypothetical protein
MLQQALTQFAQAAPDAELARERLSQAANVLAQGRQFGLLNRASFFLGETRLMQASQEQGSTRVESARQAAEALDAARNFEPFTESVWTYSAIADSLLPGAQTEAAKKRQRARELASSNFVFWADRYRNLVAETASPELKKCFASVGLEYYDASLKSQEIPPALRSHVGLGKARILLAMDRQAEAMVELLKAEPDSMREDAWQIEIALAGCFARQSSFANAKAHLELAKKTAPPDKLSAIEDFERQLPAR